MKLIISLFLLCSGSVLGCGNPSQRDAMVEYLSHEKDFMEYLCGSGCDAEQINAGIQFRSEVLREAPDVTACFVEPAKKARNFYTGVFVLRNANPPEPQFIFFGSGIGSKTRLVHKMKVLEGREIGEQGVSEISLFVWNGKAYVERWAKH